MLNILKRHACVLLHCLKSKNWKGLGISKTVLERNVLVVSFLKTYKPVSLATIVRFLKSTTSQAGIDTSVFKGHSARAASASAAALQDLHRAKLVQLAGPGSPLLNRLTNNLFWDPC